MGAQGRGESLPKRPVKAPGRGGQTPECLGTLDFFRWDLGGPLKSIDLKAAGLELFQGGGRIRWEEGGGGRQGEAAAVTQARDDRDI